MSGDLFGFEAPAFVSASVLGELLAVSERRVQQFARAGVVKRRGRGRYDLVQSVRSYVRYQQQLIDEAAAGGDLHSQRARLLRAKADQAERENAIADGDVISVALVEQALQGVLVELVQFLDALGSRIATLVPAASAQVVKASIDDDIHRAREQLCERWVHLQQGRGPADDYVPPD